MFFLNSYLILQITDTLLYTAQSVFLNHELQPVFSSPITRVQQVNYWQAIVLFITLALFISIKTLNPKKINQVLFSIINLQVAKQLFREDYRLNKRVPILLSLVFILIFAFFLQLFNAHFQLILQSTASFLQYLFFVLLLTGIYFIKFIANATIAYITNTTEIDKEYRFTVMIFNQVTAIVLFPLLVVLQFSTLPKQYIMYLCLSVITTFIVLRLYRGLVISSLEQNLGILYIFLYLCALEILPILVLIKFLLINF